MSDEIDSFEEWFKQSGYREEYKCIAKDAWNACLDLACSRFEDCEGTDYDTRIHLEA